MPEEVRTETCAGGAVFAGERLVILQRYNGVWLLPKGHVEPGETLEETALREVKEETGLAAQIGPYLGRTAYCFDDDNGVGHRKEVFWYVMTARMPCHVNIEADMFRGCRLIESGELDCLTYDADQEIARQAYIWKEHHND